jgi:hypothetical protein
MEETKNQLIQTGFTLDRLYQDKKISDEAYTILKDRNKQAINYTRCSIQLKGGKYTQAFIDYVEKYFKYKPKVYEWVSKDGKREFTHNQLCNYYEKAMIESPFIV